MGKPRLRTIGINNICYDNSYYSLHPSPHYRKTPKRYSIQFYDFDIKEYLSHEIILKCRPFSFRLAMNIFPNDLILYKTKHGIHLISFTILDNIYIPQARALRITKLLKETQDYFPYYRRDLTLRVMPKWKKKLFSKSYKTISKKPKFLGFLKRPNKDNVVSKTHLDFYFKWMNLPKKVYEEYSKNKMLSFDIKLSHYKTND